MKLNDNLQDSIAGWVDSQKKTTDLNRSVLKIKLIVIGVGILIGLWLLPGILQYFSQFFK